MYKKKMYLKKNIKNYIKKIKDLLNIDHFF